MKLNPYDKLPRYPGNFDLLLKSYILGSDEARRKAMKDLEEQGLLQIAEDIEDKISDLLRQVTFLIMNSGVDADILEYVNDLIGYSITLAKQARASQSKCENNDQA